MDPDKLKGFQRLVTGHGVTESCDTDKPKWKQNFLKAPSESPESHHTSGFWKALAAYWHIEQTITNNSKIEKPRTGWTKIIELCILMQTSPGKDKLVL